jgi:hypothetical protein
VTPPSAPVDRFPQRQPTLDRHRFQRLSGAPLRVADPRLAFTELDWQILEPAFPVARARLIAC